MISRSVNVVTMSLAGLAQFFLGVILAIAILLGGGAALALYFMHQVTTTPPKPVFANEKGAVEEKSLSVTPTEPTKASTQSTPTPTPSETPSPEPLEPGAYLARVTWSEGLSLRSDPNLDAERIGGVEYNQRIAVLEESADKNWQKIRLENSEQEGWIKTGNIERIQEE